MDLLSYERESRWMPHLSWTFPDWTLQEKMAQQAAQREQAWQKIADKLGPLLINNNVMTVNGAGCTGFGQNGFLVHDIEDQDHFELAYEKAPLLTADIKPQRNQHQAFKNNHQKSRNGYQSLNSNTQQQSSLKYADSVDSLWPSQSPIISQKRSQSSGIDVDFLEQQHQKKHHQHHHHQKKQQPDHFSDRDQRQYDCESFTKARRRCRTVSGILILLVILLLTLVILMAFGVIQCKVFPRFPL